MQWRDDLPDDWDAVPDDPPTVDRGLEHARVGGTFVVRERDGPGFVATDDPTDLADADESRPRATPSTDWTFESFESFESEPSG